MYLLTRHISRYLFALPFLGFGIAHLVNARAMSAFIPEAFPGNGTIYIYGIGVLLIVSALAILLQRYDYYAALSIAVLLFLIVTCVHAPSVSVANPVAMSNMLKDSALCGAALLYAGTKLK